MNNNRLVDWQDAGPANGFTLTDHTTGIINATFQNGGSTTANLATKAIPVGEFHHIAVTFDGSVSKLYVDGILVDSDTSTTISAASADLTVGRRSPSSSNYLNGSMAEFIFDNGICWSADDVSNIFYNKTIPSSASYYDFYSGIKDGSKNAKDGTATSCTYQTVVSGRIVKPDISHALNFIPSGSVVSINDVPELRPEVTATFTWEAWIKVFNHRINVLPRIIEKGGHYMCIMGDITNGKYGRLAVELSDDNGAGTVEYWGSTVIPENVWVKVKAECINGIVQLYVNDIPEIMTTLLGPYISPMLSSSGNALLIGNSSGGSRNFGGLISRVIWDGVGEWKFDEGVGSVAADSIGSNDGAISSALWV